ncbi:MAG TPA: AsmA family protein [Steroidobacteraceae bacterium]|nr:AsmA family protein [Steroidobacteraceae bacterium]
MISPVKLRRGLIWTGGTLLALAALLVAAGAALDAGFLHDPLVKLIAAKIDRPLRVAGTLRLHLLSRNPRLEGEDVSIGNPPWSPSGVAVEAGKISVVFATPHLGRELIIDRLTIDRATLHLFRDAIAHANWQVKDPDKSDPQSLPIIRSLSMTDAHVLLDDALKHRQFDGIVSANDAKGKEAEQAFRIEGKGKLNGRPVTFEVVGDPLLTASREQRYAFRFNERSSGARMAGSGFLRQGFDVRSYDAAFEASGADLKDMHYLTGIRLIDTGSFHLSGKLARQGHTSSFSDLLVTSGQSDVRGSMSIEGIRGQLNVNADLNSQTLRLADFGPRAAGRDAQPADEKLLLSEAAPDSSVLRRSRATMKYSAKRVEAGRVTLSDATIKLINDHGDLAVAPVAATVLGGKLQAQLKIDARKESAVPTAQLNASLSEMQLAQYPSKKGGPPALEGPADLRVDLTGRGKSLHEIAASLDGTVTATLPSGMVRDSLAELTGIDLRGLGLLLTKNKRQVPVRCGIASFEARDGTLTAKKLVLDTDSVVIAGEGFVHLDTEALDLVLRGYPKDVRFFQLRAPIAIQGTLKAPSIGIQAQDSKLVLVDPGKAKDVDCGSLLR